MVARVIPSWPAIFGDVRAALGDDLPRGLRTFRWNATSWMAKAWYGNRAIHYEIWVRRSMRVVEIGLHFEADDLTNARLLGAFRSRGREVKRALGADARIEEWDKGWARIWEPLSLDEPALAERVRARFVEYVRVLEPILREELPEDVAWTAEATSPRRSRSGRR